MRANNVFGSSFIDSDANSPISKTHDNALHSVYIITIVSAVAVVQ